MKRLAVFIACMLLASASGRAADVAAIPPLPAITFCLDQKQVCAHVDAASAPSSALAGIERINRLVNERMVLQPDPAGRDHWDLVPAAGAGDCEDSALTKMFLLSWAGISRGAMRLAVVHADWLASDSDHVLLVIRIDGVEYVLDCRDSRVRLASDISYRWIKIAREGDPLMWVSLFGAPQ